MAKTNCSLDKNFTLKLLYTLHQKWKCHNSKLLTFACWLDAFQSLYKQQHQLYNVDKVIIMWGHYRKHVCP